MPFSLRFPIALVLLIVCLATPASADFQAGMDAYNRGNYATALSELRPLAEQGDVISQYTLGALYANGYGVPQDYIQARKWYTQAAVQRYAIAQVHLGVLYEEGRGVPQDYIQARQWYTQAAVQGYAIAQVHLGVLYAEGRGVPQNFVQAHKWYNLAAANGEKVGGERRDALAKQMTPAQIFKAQRLVREWNSKMP